MPGTPNSLANFNILDTRIGDRVLDLAALTAMLLGASEEDQVAFDDALQNIAAVGGWVGKFTTAALTTAADADATITIPITGLIVSDNVMVSIANGTNAAGEFIVRTVTPAADEVEVVMRNFGAGAADGTMVISYNIARTEDVG